MHTHTTQKKEKEGRGDTNTPRTAWLSAPATHPKSPSKVGARGEVGDRAVVVEAVEPLKRGHGAVQETRVCLDKDVTFKDPRGLLHKMIVLRDS